MIGANATFVIFGGTGDLSYRKLIPALYNLYVSGKIDESAQIVAIGRRNYDIDMYISILREWTERFSRVAFTEEKFQAFTKLIVYHKLDLDDLPAYQNLSPYFDEKRQNICYYAVAPRYFSIISKGLSTLNLKGQARIVVEKPFGESLEQANRLNLDLETWFGKENIYHIDHYLGKEMIQNILSIRFTNPVFGNNWSSRDIEQVHIIASEKEGVGTRGGYYDKSGALKDMVQNHLMQILSIISVESPDENYSVKERQVQALRQLRPVSKLAIDKHMVLGQYEGYRDEHLVPPDSNTETFAFCKFYIDNFRWNGVPFYIFTGKEMETREMNVIITFKSEEGNGQPNVLTFRIQPMEGVSLFFNVKKPGDSMDVVQTEMDFARSRIPAYSINTPEAYERLLYAVLEEDHTWFSNWDLIYTSWTYAEQMKEAYDKANLHPIPYLCGSRGPQECSRVLDHPGHQWIDSQLYCRIGDRGRNSP